MRLRMWVLTGLALIAAVAFLGPLIPESILPGAEKLNCTISSFDCAAGRMRTERFLFGFHIRDDVRDTPLTERYRKVIGPPPAPRWVRVSYDTPWIMASCIGGPHMSAAFDVGNVLSAAEIAPEAERFVIEEFFRRVQRDDDDGEFARRLVRLRFPNLDCVRITLADVRAAASCPDRP